MAASDKSENTIKFLRLILLSSQTSLEVTKAFTQVTILPQYNRSFDKFLDDNKHVIYHLWKNKVPCCVGNCVMTQNESSLSTKQFKLLLNLPDTPVPGHFIKNRQHCACGLKVNPSSMEKIDISLLGILIRKLCGINNDEIVWLDTIRDIRNKLAHPESVYRFDDGRLQKWWDMLEGSILGLAAKIPPATFYHDAVERNIRLLNMSCFDVNHATYLLDQFKEENTKLQDTIEEQHIQTRQSQEEHTESLQRTIEDVKIQMKEIKDEMVKLRDTNKAVLTVELEKIVFEVVMHSIEKYFSQPTSRKDIVEVSSNPLQGTVDRKTDSLGNKCRVEWRLQQPDSWKVEQISNALQGATQMLKSWFEVEFVYAGSIVIVTSISCLIFEDLELFRHAIRSFLQDLTDLCGLSTDEHEVVVVDLRIVNEKDTMNLKRELRKHYIENEERLVDSETDDEITKNLDFLESNSSENYKSQKLTEDGSSKDSDFHESSKPNEVMMASVSTKHKCDVCKKNNLTTNASVWCFECNESLCSNCHRNHQGQNYTKEHEPILIEDYLKLSPTITSVISECEEHGIKFDFYCVNHDTPICKKCVIENHKKCSDLKLLTEVTGNIKGSFIFTSLQERASDLQGTVQQIINDLASTETRVKDETDRVVYMIEETRKAINKQLDNLQDKIMKQIKVQEKDQKEVINTTITNLRGLLIESHEILNSIEQADKHASNFHNYCGIKQWSAEIEKQEDKLSSVQTNLQYFDHFDVKVNPKLTNILTEIKNFASIEMRYTRPAMKLLKKETQGQQSLANPNVNTDIALSNARVFTIPSGKEALAICGCCVMESESMVFTDFNNRRLVHLDKKGTLLKNIDLPFHPLDTVEVDDNTVAVTSYKDNKLVLVDINQGKVVRTVYEGEWCYGLCYNDGKFYVSVPNKKIKVINMDGNVLSTVDTVDYATYCYVDKSHLYYAAFHTDSVYCCDITGKVKWRYSCDKGDYPSGITVDSKGNVLVTCHNGNKVITINRDGRASKVLLTEKDGMNKPRAISYNMKDNALLVANRNDGKCFLYNIT